MQLQHTLKKSYSFEGKGLHTGRVAKMTIKPAPVDTGICFRRTDIGEDAYVPALAENVSSTARSTTISCGDASVMTIEHVLSALTGMGIDKFLAMLEELARAGTRKCVLHIPMSEQAVLGQLYKLATVESVDYRDDYVEVNAVLDTRAQGTFKKYIV